MKVHDVARARKQRYISLVSERYRWTRHHEAAIDIAGQRKASLGSDSYRWCNRHRIQATAIDIAGLQPAIAIAETVI